MKKQSIERLMEACLFQAGLQPLKKFKNNMEAHLIKHYKIAEYLSKLPAKEIFSICYPEEAASEKSENGGDVK